MIFWLPEIVKTHRIFSWFFKVSGKLPDPNYSTTMTLQDQKRADKHYYREHSGIKDIADTSLAT